MSIQYTLLSPACEKITASFCGHRIANAQRLADRQTNKTEAHKTTKNKHAQPQTKQEPKKNNEQKKIK